MYTFPREISMKGKQYTVGLIKTTIENKEKDK